MRSRSCGLHHKIEHQLAKEHLTKPASFCKNANVKLETSKTVTIHPLKVVILAKGDATRY